MVGSAPPPRTLPVAAERALAEAQFHLRDANQDSTARARVAATRAMQLAPDWVAPRRLIDDIDRSRLIGPELLADYENQLRETPEHAPTLYLAGRLDGTSRAEERFLTAIDSDPSLAWGYHGLAWTRDLIGDRRSATNAQRRALTYARGSWERSYFTQALAQRLVAEGKEVSALDVLLERLAESDVLPTDRTTLGVRAAVVGLSLSYGKRSREGATRALELLSQGGVTELEAQELTLGLLNARAAGAPIGLPEIRLALRGVTGPGRDRLAAEVMLRESKTPLALGLLRRALKDNPAALALSPEVRSARFAVGELGEVLVEWLALQPKFVLADDGLPLDSGLRELVLAGQHASASRGQGGKHAEDLRAFGDALIANGWFTEARGLAEAMGAYDLEHALELDHRATAGRALIESLVGLVESVDARRPIRVVEPDLTNPSKEVESADLAELLLAMEPRFRRFRRETGQLTQQRDRHLGLSDSPRLRFGPVGSVIHPGPLFSEQDEQLGLGRRGEPVGGLASAFDAIGRFAVFGEAVGSGGPDGTVLRKVLVERKSGNHFGTNWQGTIAWCDGADLLSRPGRRGARIGGAALHEGFWIDIETLRGEAAVYRSLQERYLVPAAEAALQQALSVAPLPISDFDSDGLPPLLGEGDRIRIALMRDRLADARLIQASVSTRPSEWPDLVTLDELVETTATHEEGHLCDRTRFLPLGDRMWSVLVFFMESGMSAQRVEERLEYRAQLTALCKTPETRLPLAEILTAAEIGISGVTPHGAAYSRLLDDFLVELRRQVEREPNKWSELDSKGLLAHQLHRLSTEQIRSIGMKLAEAEGLLRD